MRVEFNEKIADISEEEMQQYERMGMQVKDKRYKWRRIYVFVDDVVGLYEVSSKESMLEFNDKSRIIVEGDFDTIKGIIDEAEWETYPYEESKDDRV